MEREVIKEISRIHNFIISDYQPYYQWGGFDGNYKIYNKSEINFKGQTLPFINYLKEVKVIDFYDVNFLQENHYPESYFKGELVKESDNCYGFHYQVKDILFYYLVNNYKETIKKFLEVIDSTEFTELYCREIQRDQYILKYPFYRKKDFYKFFEDRIPHFEVFFYQFNFMARCIYNDGQYTYVRTEAIESCLKSLIGFDFSKVELKLNE